MRGGRALHTPRALAAGVRVGDQTSLAFLLASKMLIKIVDMTLRRDGTHHSYRTVCPTQEMGLLPLCVCECVLVCDGLSLSLSLTHAHTISQFVFSF